MVEISEKWCCIFPIGSSCGAWFNLSHNWWYSSWCPNWGGVCQFFPCGSYFLPINTFFGVLWNYNCPVNQNFDLFIYFCLFSIFCNGFNPLLILFWCSCCPHFDQEEPLQCRFLSFDISLSFFPYFLLLEWDDLSLSYVSYVLALDSAISFSGSGHWCTLY